MAPRLCGSSTPSHSTRKGCSPLASAARNRSSSAAYSTSAAPGGHPLVVRRAAHFLQLIARHPLDYRAALLGQGCVVARHGLGHRVRQVDRIHRAAALEQLCHGILAPHKGIGALGALRRLLAANLSIASSIWLVKSAISRQ